MRTENRYCRNCKELLPHDVYKDEEGGGRLFDIMVTLGLSEADNHTNIVCQKCGKHIKR